MRIPECPSNWWDHDRIEPCHRQKYLEMLPLAGISAACLLYNIYSFASKLARNNGQPHDKFVEVPPNRTNPKAAIVLRPKSIPQRVLIFIELLCGILQFGLAFLLRDPQNHEFALYNPDVYLVFYCVTILLLIYRFVYSGSLSRLVASPFAQCAFLYSVDLLVTAAVSYSASYDPQVPFKYKSPYYLLVSASFIKWAILFTSPIGDGAARIYSVPGVEPSQEPTSSLIRSMLCCWNLPLHFVARRKKLEMSDVWELQEDYHSYHMFERYNRTMPGRHFVLRIMKCFRSDLFKTLFCSGVSAFFALMPTVFVNLILRYVHDPSSVPRPRVWLYVLGIAFTQLTERILDNQALYYGRRLSVAVRSVIIGEVYHKALYRRVTLTKPKDSDSESTSDGESESDEKFNAGNTGAVINLMSVDAFKVADFAAYAMFLIHCPILVVISVYYLYILLGFSALIGVGVMLLSIPLNYFLAKIQGAIQDQIMAVTDKRVEKTNEVISAIRIIKYFAWEHKFSENILRLRDKELHLLWQRFLWWCLNAFVFLALPLAITGSCFWSYIVLEKKELTSPLAFTALTLFNMLRYPLDDLAGNITRYISFKVSVDRIATYLKFDETEKYSQITTPTPNSDIVIGFKNATVSWFRPDDDSAVNFKLPDLNINFKVGELNVIIGPTGAGKSSLLLALLGEMHLESGEIFLPGAVDRESLPIDPATGLSESVAYCAQQAWLVNDTVRNNILFAAPYDQSRYELVLKSCELERDLAILEDGDRTMIGDKGITLSGGQKQRVSLARALYSHSKHLLLDDCLSAVDSHTAEALYKNAITGKIAKNRTIILVSHNAALVLSLASTVSVVSNGRITAHGSPDELSANGSLGDDDLVNKSALQSQASRAASQVDLSALSHVHQAESAPHITHTGARITHVRDEEEDEEERMKEERGLGSIPFSTYKRYIWALGGPMFWLITILSVVGTPASEYAQTFWVKVWTASYEQVSLYTLMRRQALQIPMVLEEFGIHNETVKSLSYYLGIYVFLGTLAAGAATFRDFMGYYGSVRASKRLFTALLDSIIRANIRFFDTTPSGQIMNRFSKDIETIDQEMMSGLIVFILCTMDGIAVTLVISWATPAFIIPGLVTVLIYVGLANIYLTCSRELKRLEAVTRSPVFQQFGETLDGAVTIRALGDTKRFSVANMNAVDYNHRPYFNLWLSNRYLALSCNVVSTTIVVLAAIFVLLSHERIGAGTAGISLSYAMMFGDVILWLVRCYAEVEINMNSIERIQKYLEIDHEAAGIIPESRPATNWPTKGQVEFRGISLRYSEDLPLVIKNVSFKVEGGFKVGVVGRTGAGKSTVISALFRLLEPVAGSIYIDGLDISNIGLYDLRKQLAIIPQDPTLFQGTLRTNLDPFDEYSDNEIFKSLGRVKLVPHSTTVSNVEEHRLNQAASENVNQFLDLSSEVTEGGKNLSQGQRQLVCLARSLLKSPRVLLLDEATASIDYDTDAMIQSTIRQEFGDVTILTIAHRLRTIADYDRIVVLEKGELVQFGPPGELLKDKNGFFFKMCEKSGELETLLELANK